MGGYVHAEDFGVAGAAAAEGPEFFEFLEAGLGELAEQGIALQCAAHSGEPVVEGADGPGRGCADEHQFGGIEPTFGLEHAEDLRKHAGAVGVEVQYTVGEHHVEALVLEGEVFDIRMYKLQVL